MKRPSIKRGWRHRQALWMVVAVATGFAVAGCAGPEPGPPSILEQTVDAIDQENWERADHLLSYILPPVPAEAEGVTEN